MTIGKTFAAIVLFGLTVSFSPDLKSQTNASNSEEKAAERPKSEVLPVDFQKMIEEAKRAERRTQQPTENSRTEQDGQNVENTPKAEKSELSNQQETKNNSSQEIRSTTITIGKEEAADTPAKNSKTVGEEVSLLEKSKNAAASVRNILVNIAIVAVALFPLTALLIFELFHPSSSSFKKIREFPLEGFGALVTGVAFILFGILPVGVFFLIFGTSYFVNDGMGCYVNYKKMTLTLPANYREADSFFSYLNPIFYLRSFFRSKIRLADIIDVNHWTESNLETDNNGKLKVKHTNRVQISTKDGSYMVKFRSPAKCQRLIASLRA